MDSGIDFWENSINEDFNPKHNVSLDLFNYNEDTDQSIYLPDKKISESCVESIIDDSNYVSEESATITEGSIEKEEDSLEYQLDDGILNSISSNDIVEDINNAQEITIDNLAKISDLNASEELITSESVVEDISKDFNLLNEPQIDIGTNLIRKSELCNIDVKLDKLEINNEEIDEISDNENIAQKDRIEAIDYDTDGNYFDCEEMTLHNNDTELTNKNVNKCLLEISNNKNSDECKAIGTKKRYSKRMSQPIVNNCTNQINSPSVLQELSDNFSDTDTMDLADKEFTSSDWLYSVASITSSCNGDNNELFDIDKTFSFSQMILHEQINNRLSLTVELTKKNGLINNSYLNNHDNRSINSISPVSFSSGNIISSTPCCKSRIKTGSRINNGTFIKSNIHDATTYQLNDIDNKSSINLSSLTNHSEIEDCIIIDPFINIIPQTPSNIIKSHKSMKMPIIINQTILPIENCANNNNNNSNNETMELLLNDAQINQLKQKSLIKKPINTSKLINQSSSLLLMKSNGKIINKSILTNDINCPIIIDKTQILENDEINNDNNEELSSIVNNIIPIDVNRRRHTIINDNNNITSSLSNNSRPTSLLIKPNNNNPITLIKKSSSINRIVKPVIRQSITTIKSDNNKNNNNNNNIKSQSLIKPSILTNISKSQSNIPQTLSKRQSGIQTNFKARPKREMIVKKNIDKITSPSSETIINTQIPLIPPIQQCINVPILSPTTTFNINTNTNIVSIINNNNNNNNNPLNRTFDREEFQMLKSFTISNNKFSSDDNEYIASMTSSSSSSSSGTLQMQSSNSDNDINISTNNDNNITTTNDNNITTIIRTDNIINNDINNISSSNNINHNNYQSKMTNNNNQQEPITIDDRTNNNNNNNNNNNYRYNIPLARTQSMISSSKQSQLLSLSSSQNMGIVYQLALKEEENLKKQVNTALIRQSTGFRSLKLPSQLKKTRGIPIMKK